MSQLMLELNTAEIQSAIRLYLESKGYKLEDRPGHGITFRSDKMVSVGNLSATVKKISVSEHSEISEAHKEISLILDGGPDREKPSAENNT